MVSGVTNSIGGGVGSTELLLNATATGTYSIPKLSDYRMITVYMRCSQGLVANSIPTDVFRTIINSDGAGWFINGQAADNSTNIHIRVLYISETQIQISTFTNANYVRIYGTR